MTYSSGEVHGRISQFYARQMRLLDEGAVEEWADTFTEDAVFEEPSLPEPLKGRPVLVEAARRRVGALAAQGRVRRHWLGMLEVSEGAEPGVLHTRYYALALSTAAGEGVPSFHSSTVAEDLLEPYGEAFLVRHRSVRHD
ncbi:nuclear transport factor 2 family protein [Streptomyces sp. P17]|uniref:nuclear transport factor 2 family protein n=1 Tax=Streptomyces sp. P17 TaxID=3074716 RepID=UPI0028F4081A|nr:nuclear transport factor 2 family protein [Streptomyces sp. P17]MDT9694644.1 nuclear transport factor 2 family protein [Streptomyces sp. P17]